MPINTPTPSRRLRQIKIKESFEKSPKRPAPDNNTTETINTNGDNTENSKLRAVEVISLSDNSEGGEEEEEDEDEHQVDTSRKSARTKHNTSPSKQQLHREAMASKASFGRTSTVSEKYTPSTMLQGLSMQTPAMNARLQHQRVFDAVTPVPRPNLSRNPFLNAMVASQAASSQVVSSSPDPNDPFTSPAKETPIDAEREVFELLGKAGVELPDAFWQDVKGILELAMKRQQAYLRAQQKEIKDLTKENDSLKQQLLELEEFEEEKAQLEDWNKELEIRVGELEGQQDVLEKAVLEERNILLEGRVRELEEQKETLERDLAFQKEILREIEDDYVP
ncbi:hypothetical protein ABW20_dc0109650 [Dactylellina cionopaga]|nr:hypothetical protein ABW20_dc0109650 [Dactylellina cionopaga]